jgi:protoporphyrinogen oxidase
MDRTRYLVVGAGVSGLSFANWIASDDYIVCEREPEPGGYCRTIKKDGFVWDYSGHFFHFRHKDLEEYLVSQMGDQKVLTVTRDSRCYHDGRLVDFPFQKNIHQLPRQDFIDCLVDLYFREDKEPSNFQEMLYAKFGRSIAEMFLIPYNEKLYATDLSNLDVDAMGRFFPYADVSQIIGNFRRPDNRSYNATFTYPEGGAVQYINALRQGVKDERISLGEQVEAIDLKNKVARTNKREIAFEYLISSAPFIRLLQMTGMPHDPSIYTWNKVQVFNLGFDRKGHEGIHWIYFPQREFLFYRVGFYDNIFSTDRMSLYVEIGRPNDFEIDDYVINSTLDRVLTDLDRCGIVDGHELVAWDHVVLDPAYVHITEQSNEDVTQKKRALQACGVYSLGRYGSWTYCSIEDNMVEARALARTLNTVEGL